jgi:hypothetical protein
LFFAIVQVDGEVLFAGVDGEDGRNGADWAEGGDLEEDRPPARACMARFKTPHQQGSAKGPVGERKRVILSLLMEKINDEEDAGRSWEENQQWLRRMTCSVLGERMVRNPAMLRLNIISRAGCWSRSRSSSSRSSSSST